MSDAHDTAADARDAFSDDVFLGGRLSLKQPLDGPRAGMDAVFLAAACPAVADSGERVLDAGAASGAVSLCVAARVPGVDVTGVEIDQALCAAFRENITRNGFAGRVRAVEADLTAPVRLLSAAGLGPGSFDHLLANPPFFETGDVRLPRSPRLRRAHVSEDGTLGAWIRVLTAMAAPKATLTLVHLPSALPELLGLLERRFGGIAVFPLFAKPGAPAIRILMQARKGSRADLKLLPGLVLHEPDGRFTPAAQAILRAGAALCIAG
jgi:tRNA1(Val) A37 N6-methylase TrmN6